ncbi:RDD family protein [Flavobacterium sp. ZB4R12]|uniref:RDD family protein n=1 Tax=Flavobacterium sp. ZB4R12 TaxID=3398732 RepID=UPI003AAEAB83
MENKNFTVTDDLLASKGQRFLNFIIDLVIIYVIEISIGTTLILIADITNSPGLSESVESLGIIEQILFGVIILILYYSFSEIYFSRTFAKYFTKTMVVLNDGSKPDNRTVFARTFCRLIPIDPFTFLGSNPRGWHDTISSTYVVSKHEFVEKRKLFFEEIGGEL